MKHDKGKIEDMLKALSDEEAILINALSTEFGGHT